MVTHTEKGELLRILHTRLESEATISHGPSPVLDEDDGTNTHHSHDDTNTHHSRPLSLPPSLAQTLKEPLFWPQDLSRARLAAFHARPSTFDRPPQAGRDYHGEQRGARGEGGGGAEAEKRSSRRLEDFEVFEPC